MFAGAGFEFETRTFGNLATGLGGGFVFRESGGGSGLGNLAGGKVGKGGEDEFSFAHMIAQILGLKPFQVLVGFHADTTPFLMDEVGEDGVFLAFFDIMLGPIVGEFVAGFLAGHALLDPLVTATVFLPGGASAFEGERGIGNFLHPLVADFGQPEFDRFGFRAGHTLDEPQQGLGSGDIGEVVFAVGGRQFQSVTICHRLTPFLAEPLFQLVPVLPGSLEIRLLGEDPGDAHLRLTLKVEALCVQESRLRDGYSHGLQRLNLETANERE